MTDELHLADRRVIVNHPGWLHDEECHYDAQLEQDENERYDQLGAGAHKSRLLCADLLLAAGQDPSDAVSLGDQGGVAHGRGEADAQSL